jgi:hypothetical protein
MFEQESVKVANRQPVNQVLELFRRELKATATVSYLTTFLLD